ncbi:MAG: hypothetical protein M1458_00885 [Deltaproteobacteria bacterium]|nr:hypothetical protein [Deltaproteobacteria bacterium]
MQSKILKNNINVGAGGEYFYITHYIPKNAKGIPSPLSPLDEYSGLILRYKKGDYKIISFFARLLSNIIYNYLYPYDLILPVPPSNSYLDNYPNSIVCSHLASMGLIDYLKGGIVCVKGHKPNHVAGEKYKNSFAGSISVKDTGEFKSKNIILFDDIITTGITFRTIKQALLRKEANSVIGLFLGKTLLQPDGFSRDAHNFSGLQEDFNG